VPVQLLWMVVEATLGNVGSCVVHASFTAAGAAHAFERPMLVLHIWARLLLKAGALSPNSCQA